MTASQEHDWILRPATRSDLQNVCELINTCSLALHGVRVDAQRNVDLTWRQPGFSLETDTRVAVLFDGRIVGYSEVEDTEAPHVRAGSWMRVHPQFNGLGIEVALLDWVERRANETIAKAPSEARVTLTQGIQDEDLSMKALLEQSGFVSKRHFWRMEIDLLGDLPEPAWADDISVRTFVLEEDLEALVHAHRNAFCDHWGHVDVPFEQELREWGYWIRNDPEFDQTLTFLAMADATIAGYSSCDPRHSEDPAMGYVSVLGVTRPWRRRGIALALLHHTFREFKNRGQQRVCLGVDAASLTGAVGLYEAAGMRSTRQTTIMEKELRPGVDLSLQALGGGTES